MGSVNLMLFNQWRKRFDARMRKLEAKIEELESKLAVEPEKIVKPVQRQTRKKKED